MEGIEMAVVVVGVVGDITRFMLDSASILCRNAAQRSRAFGLFRPLRSPETLAASNANHVNIALPPDEDTHTHTSARPC